MKKKIDYTTCPKCKKTCFPGPAKVDPYIMKTKWVCANCGEARIEIVGR